MPNKFFSKLFDSENRLNISQFILILLGFVIIPFNFGYWWIIAPDSFNMYELIFNYNLNTFYEFLFIFGLIWLPIFIGHAVVGYFVKIMPVVGEKDASGNITKKDRDNEKIYKNWLLALWSMFPAFIYFTLSKLYMESSLKFTFIACAILIAIHVYFCCISRVLKRHKWNNGFIKTSFILIVCTSILYIAYLVVMLLVEIEVSYLSMLNNMFVVALSWFYMLTLSSLLEKDDKEINSSDILDPYPAACKRYNGETDKIFRDITTVCKGLCAAVVSVVLFFLYITALKNYIDSLIGDGTTAFIIIISLLSMIILLMFYLFLITNLHEHNIMSDIPGEEKKKKTLFYLIGMFVMAYMTVFVYLGMNVAEIKIIGGKNFFHASSNLIGNIRGLGHVISLGTLDSKRFIVPLGRYENSIDSYFHPVVYTCKKGAIINKKIKSVQNKYSKDEVWYDNFTFINGILESKKDVACKKGDREDIKAVYFECGDSLESHKCIIRQIGMW